jgi:hypothetical protein
VTRITDNWLEQANTKDGGKCHRNRALGRRASQGRRHVLPPPAIRRPVRRHPGQSWQSGTVGPARDLLAAITALGGILAGPVTAASQTAQPDPTGDRSVDIPVEADVRLELVPVDGDREQAIWLGDRRATPRRRSSPSVRTRAAANPRHRDLPRQRHPPDPLHGHAGRPAVWPLPGGHLHPRHGGRAHHHRQVPPAAGPPHRGNTTLKVRQPAEQLRLDPETAAITAGGSKRYTAIGLTNDEKRLGDVTGQTRFSVTQAGRRPSTASGQSAPPPGPASTPSPGPWTRRAGIPSPAPRR